jgi:hypothetical protein
MSKSYICNVFKKKMPCTTDGFLSLKIQHNAGFSILQKLR